jgi:hypothetical protein
MSPVSAPQKGIRPNPPLKGLPICLVILVGLAGFLSWGGLTRGHGWGGDFAQYIMQAVSIVEGQPQQFIDMNRVTVEQSSKRMGPVAYPWGLPVLLAPLYAFFGLDILALKAVSVVSFLLFLVVFWFSLDKRHSAVGRIACVSLFALNPSLLRATDRIISDIPFLLISTLAVFLIGVAIVEGRRFISPAYDHLLLGGVIGAAFFIRTNGVLLLVALAISQAVAAMLRAGCAPTVVNTPHGNGTGVREIGIGLLPYVSFAIIAMTWTAMLPEGGGSHVEHLRGVSLERIVAQAHDYLELPATFFTGVPHHLLVYGTTIPLALIGAIGRARSDYHIVVYMALTVGLYVVWPSDPYLRFLFPILPFYVSWVVGSLDEPKAPFTPRALAGWGRAIRLVPVVVVLLYFGRASATHVLDNLSRDRATRSGPFVQASQEMFSFIRTHTPTDSTIVFFKPRILRLLTGRNSVSIGMTSADQLGRGDYLCYYRIGTWTSQGRRSDIDRLVTSRQLHLVYQNDDFECYRTIKQS